MDFRKILIVMIEPITYLYYKCYKLYAFFNKENPAFQYGVLFGVMICINIAGLVILINNEFPLFDWGWVIILIISIVLESIVSHFEDRIVKKYDNMNKKKKIIGNIIFIVEIIITILFLILIYEYIPVG